MYNIIKKNNLVKLALLGLSLAFFTTLFIATQNENDKNEKHASDTQSENIFVPKEDASFFYPVSGTVEATNNLTVHAKTAGTVTSILGEEGTFVNKGDALVVQTVPLLKNKIDLQESQNTLAELSQNNALIQSKSNLDKSLVNLNSAQKNLELTVKNISKQDKNTASLLLTQTNASALTLVSTLNFIDEYEAYFPSETLKKFKETVAKLYGEEKTYMTGYVKYNIKSNESILDKLRNINIETYSDLEKLITLAKTVDDELDATKNLLEDAEYRFLDSHTFSTSDTGYTSYLSNRASVIETQANLRNLISTADSVLMQNSFSLLNSDTNNKIGFINSQSADNAFGNQSDIYKQTTTLSKKQLDLLRAQQNLGVSTSPFPGVIKDVFVDYGEYLMPGSPILTIVGNTAQEIKVTVPKTILPMLHVGDAFVSNEVIVGHVDRFAPVLSAGKVEVFISLENGEYTNGDTLKGSIEITLDGLENVVYVPRDYLHFDNSGVFVLTEEKEPIQVQIVYDGGKFVLVKSENITSKKLTPSKGITF
jgi:multidrug efflux pump subunit AcrA (membrane-fusion protein)